MARTNVDSNFDSSTNSADAAAEGGARLAGQHRPAGPGVAGAKDHIWRAIMGLVLLVGITGQIRVWASDRGFWNDELYIAENLRSLSFKELDGALIYLQVAPPGWMIGEKALLELFGPNEQVLKLPQVVATTMVLCLAAFVAYRAVGRWGAVIAASLIAMSPLVDDYAAELKQYAPEAALAMVIVAAVGVFGTTVLRAETVTPPQLIIFVSVVAIAVAGSYSALVVLAGAVAGLVVLLARERRWHMATLALVAVAPGLLIGVFQVLRRRQFGFMRNQDGFFPNGFPPEDPSVGDLVRWLPKMWHGFVVSPLNWHYSGIVLAVLVAGMVSLVLRGERLWAAIIAGVFLAATAAAAVHGLPLEGRVALYLIAPTAIALAAAVDGGIRALRFLIPRGIALRAGAVAFAAAGLVVITGAAGLVLAVAPAAAASYAQVAEPRYRDDGRDMLREVAQRLQPGDVVLAYYFSEPLMSWYGRLYELPMVGLAKLTTGTRCQPGSVDAAVARAKRVWYVHGAKLSWHPVDYSDRVLAQLAKRGTITESSTRWRPAGWTIVDLGAGPDKSQPNLAFNPDYACLTVSPVRRL